MDQLIARYARTKPKTFIEQRRKAAFFAPYCYFPKNYG